LPAPVPKFSPRRTFSSRLATIDGWQDCPLHPTSFSTPLTTTTPPRLCRYLNCTESPVVPAYPIALLTSPDRPQCRGTNTTPPLSLTPVVNSTASKIYSTPSTGAVVGDCSLSLVQGRSTSCSANGRPAVPLLSKLKVRNEFSLLMLLIASARRLS
jgi:hypothetical protein